MWSERSRSPMSYEPLRMVLLALAFTLAGAPPRARRPRGPSWERESLTSAPSSDDFLLTERADIQGDGYSPHVDADNAWFGGTCPHVISRTRAELR